MRYKIKEDTECNCLYCNSPIYGRLDKKFCNDDCKNKFNNLARRHRKEMYEEDTRRLKKNYSILENLLNANIKSARLNELDALGFNADYCTYSIRRNNYRCCHCYDIEYQITRSKIYNIARR